MTTTDPRTGKPVSYSNKSLELEKSRMLQQQFPGGFKDPSSGKQVIQASGSAPMSSSSGGSSSRSSSSRRDSLTDAVSSARRSQEEAASRAAEASRQAAKRSYEGKVTIANSAKESAGQSYNWIIDTLGSNKQDLLNQIATSESTGLQNYDTQKGDTVKNYDKSKQDILFTYRDLGVQQEKILRGSGAGFSSSRSQEALLKLNNFMGKDLSEVTTNEADSLALIGNAVTTFKQKTQDARISVESETKSKLDKAGIDYNASVRAIDNNLTLAGNAREDAYANAQVALAQATAGIQNWALQAKVSLESQIASAKGILDNYVVDAADYNGGLNRDLQSKQAAAQSAIGAIDNSLLINPGGGNEGDLNTSRDLAFKAGRKTYGSKDELDAALQRGEINQGQYSTLASQFQYSDPLMSAALA